jgi:topoisomerase-4 subunit A
MVRIEKYGSEKVFACIHLDGKSKNYYIKRFVFEDLAIGKRAGFINEESGSKMVILSSADHPIVKIEALKGKSQIFDEQEVDLSEAIDVKGMKAQGNKLSPHDVQKITLISEENEDAEEAEEEIETDDSENNSGNDNDNNSEDDDIAEEDTEPKEEVKPKSLTKSEEAPKAEEIKPKTEEIKKPTFTSTPKPAKDVDFEITNPDDIKLDDKGQLGLF